MNLTKAKLRERILRLLKSQSEEERLKKSRVIAAKLLGNQEFREARTVLFYASCKGEVDTFEMMKQACQMKKTIGLPRVINPTRFIPARVDDLESLETGPYGIAQPKNDKAHNFQTDMIDLVIVPGVAFDRRNNRLGRGLGCYDRFLKSLPKEVPTIGLAFDFQIVDLIPSLDNHDHPVSLVLSN
jgi:5-formyltetrahydrofolate cyclo-ligase